MLFAGIIAFRTGKWGKITKNAILQRFFAFFGKICYNTEVFFGVKMLSASATRETITARAAMASASGLSSKVTYGASGVTVFAGLNLESVGVIVGIIIAIVSLFVNIYYQRKKHNLDVLLAHSQLEKIATATVDENQRVLFERMRDELVKEFGNVNKRTAGDRRVYDDPNYAGIERRRGVRRKSVNGDTEAAKALSIVAHVTKNAVQELDKENGGE